MKNVVINVRANGTQFVCRPEGYDESFFFGFCGFSTSAFAAALIRRRLGLSNAVKLSFCLV